MDVSNRRLPFLRSWCGDSSEQDLQAIDKYNSYHLVLWPPRISRLLAWQEYFSATMSDQQSPCSTHVYTYPEESYKCVIHWMYSINCVYFTGMIPLLDEAKGDWGWWLLSHVRLRDEVSTADIKTIDMLMIRFHWKRAWAFLGDLVSIYSASPRIHLSSLMKISMSHTANPKVGTVLWLGHKHWYSGCGFLGLKKGLPFNPCQWIAMWGHAGMLAMR